MENYFDKLLENFESLSDEEFEQLLINAGIENCPYENQVN